MAEIDWEDTKKLIEQLPIYMYAIAKGGEYLTIDGFREKGANDMLVYSNIVCAKIARETHIGSTIVVLEIDFEDYIDE